MTAAEINLKISALLDEAFASEAYADCYLVDLVLSKTNKLEVYVDADSGIDFDKCKHFSRIIEAQLDAEGWLGEDYTLEVSSPGLSRPLKFARQYVKNIGRNLKVALADGSEVEGKLILADEAGFQIEFETKRKEGKKTIREMMQPRYSYDAVAKALVYPSFKE